MADMSVSVHTKEIVPGVTLTICPTDRFKVDLFSLTMSVPLDREMSPIRSLMLAVLRRGCRDYPNLSAINRRLDELYATPYRVVNSTRGGYHCLGFGAELLEDRYLPCDGSLDLCAEVLSLMGQMLYCPILDEDGMLSRHYVEAEKKQTVDAIRSLRNHAASYAMAQFSDLFYEDQAYGHLLCGTEEQVRAITAEQLTKEWRDMLRRAPIRCFYVGGMDEQVLIERLRSMLFPYLETCKYQPTATPPLASVPIREEQVRFYDTQGDAGQSHLILGFESGVTLRSPDFYAMMLCHELLGLSPISRLFVHVREAESLCYSCTSEYRIEQGDVIVSCGISATNRTRAQEAILSQIKALQTGDFTDAEWQAARKSLTGGYRQLVDSTRSLARFYELRAMAGVDQTIESCRSRFEAVTREDVMAAARKLSLRLVYFRAGAGTDGDEEDDDA